MTNTKRQPYPLQWPEDWKRTAYRDQPKFTGRFVEDRDEVLRRLARRGTNVVITSNLPLRRDGLPYADSRCSDPGLAVYWIETRWKDGKPRNTERVLACDRWRSVGDNMRAIAKTLDALAGIDRWGASQIVERAFAGFAALPAAGETSVAQRPWREVLGGVWPEFEPTELVAIARARFKARMRVVHPDAGGSHEQAAELNQALSEAELELIGDIT